MWLLSRAAAIGVFAVWSAALAQDALKDSEAARLAAARDLVAAQGGVEQARKFYEQTIAAFSAELRRTHGGGAEQAMRAMENVLNASNPKISGFFDEVQEIAVRFYAERFTIEEMSVATAFISSSAGKKFQAAAPDLLAVLAPAYVRFQNTLFAEIKDAMARGEPNKK